MKRIFAIVLFTAAMLFAGCQNSPQRTAYNATASTVTTVDAAMTGWGQYVVSERTRIAAIQDLIARSMETNRLLEKEGKVQAAYETYRNAMVQMLSASDPPVILNIHSPSADQIANLLAIIAAAKL